MDPSIGRIVHYKLSTEDVGTIATQQPGATEVPGDVFPMIIVRVSKDFLVNGRVFLDGGELFVRDVKEGAKTGTWAWPPRV